MDYLRIENFKCFNKIEIPLNQLTILAGANGNGKSTVIQSLLFLRRTIEHCGTWNLETNSFEYQKSNGLNVELNGSYGLNLGESDSIQNQNIEDRNTVLEFEFKNTSLIVEYEFPEGSDLWLKPFGITNSLKTNSLIDKQQFYYLNAERLGPRIKQDIKFYDYPTTGIQGEYVAQLLGDTGFSYKFQINDDRLFEKNKNKRLEFQVNAWLNYIIPGVKVFATYDTSTMSAQIRVSNLYSNNNNIVATNIGFGISYVLPIIVSGLIAEKDSLLIIENPEAHLHPSAQSKIGKFIAMVANSGVKVIIETHSDHFINGIQLATALNEINTSLITINYFSQEDDIDQPKIESISINEKGELSNWPKGFFDQTQRDFAELFKIRKG
ncbi:DUF3696 domain-containing protein [Flavobacterium sp.]|uniref:AAA family ATPase n=1 Tax=Flavobacterium sp. TaxID=239 RepID=UPI0031DE527F